MIEQRNMKLQFIFTLKFIRFIKFNHHSHILPIDPKFFFSFYFQRGSRFQPPPKLKEINYLCDIF